MAGFWNTTVTKVNNGYIVANNSEMLPHLNRCNVAKDVEEMVNLVDAYATEFEVAFAEIRKRAEEKRAAADTPGSAAPLTAPPNVDAKRPTARTAATPPAPKAAESKPH